MTAADDAYREAERLIAEAKRTGARGLSFDRPETRALTVLPEGISDFVGLDFLFLSNTRVRNLSPLAGQTGITALTLDNTSITDLSPLENLTRIKTLWLDNTPITDLSPLQGLTGIKQLTLSNSKFTDLSPLMGLTGITDLSLNNTQITDFSPLARLTGITELALGSPQFTDLSPIMGLTGITGLSLAGTRITDFSPLAGLQRITVLWLDNTQITDLSPLSGLTGITVLGLSGTKISNLTPIASLTGITMLSLDNTQVLDLRVLPGMEGLATEPRIHGLSFTGCAAARADPRIAEIAGIKDPKARAAALFALLDSGWQPQVAPVAQDRPSLPVVPDQVPAPILVEIEEDGRLAERIVPPLGQREADARAKEGWSALRELQADAEQTLCKDNLPNLTRAVRSFGRALGDTYEGVSVIALGTHGRRIIEMSRTIPDVLLEDAGGDLVAYADAITVFLPRFPDWVAYLRDAEAAPTEGPPIRAAQLQLQVIVNVLLASEQVEPAVAQKFDDLIEAAADAEVADEVVKRGILASLSNIFAEAARWAFRTVGKGIGDYGAETYKTVIKMAAGAPVGAVVALFADLFLANGQLLLGLAQSYPAMLGWIVPVLRVFGIP